MVAAPFIDFAYLLFLSSLSSTVLGWRGYSQFFLMYGDAMPLFSILGNTYRVVCYGAQWIPYA